MADDFLCCCCSMSALDITDYEKRCRALLARESPAVKWALLTLEILAIECKRMTDKNAVEYDTHPVFHFLKNLPTTLPFETEETISMLTKLKYMYHKKKLLSILRGNLFSEYAKIMKMRLHNTSSVSDIEDLVRKFVKVCQLIPPQTELSTDDLEQYEFLAHLLDFCCRRNVGDSQLIITLLKMTVKKRLLEPTDVRLVRQPQYSGNFLRYILEHARKEKFDVSSYCNKHLDTLWEFSRNFSVLNAVSFGNVPRTLLLLQYGVDVFSDREMQKGGHGFPFIEEVIPPVHLLILTMMCGMRSVNFFLLNNLQATDSAIFRVTEDQKRCFKLVWRSLKDSLVNSAEIESSTFQEYVHLIQHYILHPMRYEKNLRYLTMYGRCFEDMANSVKEPRSLQHLSRCAVRSSLRESCHLPHGIYQLQLPQLLHEYLNLERD